MKSKKISLAHTDARYSVKSKFAKAFKFFHPQDMICELDKTYKRYRHQRIMGNLVMDAIDQAEKDPENITHLVITATPQIGKSYFFSVPIILWYLNKFPDRGIMYCTHTHSLAEKFTSRALQFFVQNRDKLDFDLGKTLTGKYWETNKGGFVLACGKDTAIPGYRGDLQIIDDLYSSEQEAFSPTILEKVEGWWESSLSTRMQKHTLQIIITTRWNKKDIVGYLKKKEAENPDAAKYKVVNFSALVENQEDIDNDPLGRELGESICEDRYSAKWYRQRKASISKYRWAALYKGDPDDTRGQIFQDCWFKYYEERDGKFYLHYLDRTKIVLKAHCTFFQVTDTNLKDGTQHDHHVTTTFALTPENDLLVYDVYRDQIEGADTLKAIRAQRRKHSIEGKSYIQRNYVEDVQAGTVAIQQARKEGEGFMLLPLKAVKNKVERAIPYQEAFINGKVWHPLGKPWVGDWEKEHLEFTGEDGGVDDRVDTGSYAMVIVLNRKEYKLETIGAAAIQKSTPKTVNQNPIWYRPTKRELENLR